MADIDGVKREIRELVANQLTDQMDFLKVVREVLELPPEITEARQARRIEFVAKIIGQRERLLAESKKKMEDWK